MNTKKFTVVDTRTNRTKTFESTANTVGELKVDLRREGIDPTGMAIQEGLTKTELGDNDGAYLPHDVPYRGSTTNNLVFRLTQKEKKIRSGAMSRGKAYDKVKALGLTDMIAKKYGKNFTMCKTSDLIAEIEAYECKKNCAYGSNYRPVTLDAFKALLHALVDNDAITEKEAMEIAYILGTELFPDDAIYSSSEDDALYSNSEIDQMFADM